LELDKINNKNKHQLREDNRRLLKLIKNGYKIFITDPNIDISNIKKVHNIEYNIIPKSEITDQMINRFKILYDKLYLEKYSKYNPQFTTEWIKLFLNLSNTELFWIVDPNNKIIGMCGYYKREDKMTAPLVGYDLDLDLAKSNNLYTGLMYLLFVEIDRLKLIGHKSGGVGRYKINRGCVEYVEYNMIYSKNLDIKKRLTYWLLSMISKMIESLRKLITI
jgi:hypothetical protein